MTNKAKFHFLIFTFYVFLSSSFAEAALCKQDQQVSIKMSDAWHRNEEMRLVKEEKLLTQYAEYISKNEKVLVAEKYNCVDKKNCDEMKNCQMEKDVKDVKEVEYLIKADSGITIAKAYCSKIGKCIGYNDFIHDSKVTAAEDRLIDIKHDNAIFYHYFYSAKAEGYEPLFNITNFHTGYELYLQDVPRFSPDDRFMIEVHSVPKNENLAKDFPTGFNINIYEINEYGEYRNIEPEEFDKEDPTKVVSTFLSRNPLCGEAPHFHSWKNNREVRLFNPPLEDNSEGKKVILFYDKKLNKWACKEDDDFSDNQCIAYLPDSLDYVSNMAPGQLNNCK